ncbi:uncharacterized protein LOC108466362 [Gossypium arboreum]|uniref:uncharacterized protein LOC108466362 n=1 Tax=Gossypium arboreum TaxID=29729 RepID=UPI0008192E98|nr:uncharacterized protein LOC108466362 [Gossypium arboreum]
MDDESLYEAWERFKELLHKFPHHVILHFIQLETFYSGLKAHTRLVVDTFANGALLSKSYNEAYEIIERIASNNYQCLTNRVALERQVVGVHEVDALPSLLTQGSYFTNGNTLEPKEAMVEDEPIEKEENQPIVEIPTPKEPKLTKFYEALEQMPNYVKFMKDILSKKRTPSEFETIALTKECSEFLQNKLPLKIKDPRSLLYPVILENLTVVKLYVTLEQTST